MKKKLIATIVCSAICVTTAATGLGLAACGGHEHTYSDDWNFDTTYHWHDATCEHTDVYGDKSEHVFVDDKCSTCGALLVNYEFNASDYEAKSYDTDFISGIFTVGAKTTIRARTRTELYDEQGVKIKDVDFSKSIQISDANSLVKINAPAAGKLIIYAQYGSSTATDTHSLSLVKPNGATTPITYRATGGALQYIEVDLEEKGVYQIKRVSGTSDIFYMSFTAAVIDTPVEKIQVGSAGTVNYFVGQEFNSEGLSIQAVHKDTGRISPVDINDLDIDSSEYDANTPGTYTIKVSYTVDGETFETSYDVVVSSFAGISLGTDMIVKSSKNTSAGNGVYENISLRQFYFTGETLSTAGLSVTLETDDDLGFLLKSGEYTVSEVDMTTAGKKTVTVSYTTNGITKSATFDIYVAAKDGGLTTAQSVDLVVNATTTDSNVGVKNASGAYQFKTIHQALDFLNNSGVSANAQKTITLAAGTYWEKLEISVPNLTIVGADKDTTIIEYDSLYGIKDAGGFEHTTDSTATLNVREAAENFTIKGVTVSNWFNSIEHFDEKLGAGYGEHRALALLVQSDKFTMYDCALLGYQDTVEFFTGRQYIVNTYIAGTTDFIFGTNNTTYFYNCEIHSIYNGSKDGGYITAFKGNNKDASDAVLYGAIFDNCHFTADDEVQRYEYEVDGEGNKVVKTVGNTAIGRPWGAYAAVAVINSEIDGHVSLAGYAGASKNTRYVSMSGVAPTAATVKFVEYNNTGAGAITEAVDGMRFLEADEAANYSDFNVFFGTSNGGVKYTAVWVPVNPEAATHSVIVKDSSGTTIGTLTIEEGKGISEAQIAGLIANSAAHSDKDFEKAFSDEDCTQDFDLSTAIMDDTTIYITLVVGPIKSNVVWKFSVYNEDYQITAGTANIGKLYVDATDGTFVGHFNGDNFSGWSKITGNATLSLDLLADTVVTVKSYDDGLGFALDGSQEGIYVSFASQTYTVEVRQAGKLVISKNGNGYIGDVAVTVNAGLSFEKSTVSLYNGDNVVGTIEDWNGHKITENQLLALMNGVTEPGKEFEGFYSDSACNSAFDFSTVISENTSVYIKWQEASDYLEENTTISFGNLGNYNTYLNNNKLTLTAPEGSSWNGESQLYCNKINEGTVVSVKVKAGATIVVTSYTNYTNYSVEDTNYTTSQNMFHVNEDGEFVLTSGAGNYIYSIAVIYDLAKAEDGYTYTYANGGRNDNEVEPSTEKVAFVTCYVNNSWLRLDKGASVVVLNVDAGAKIEVTTNGGKLAISDGTVSVSGTTVNFTVSNAGYVMIYGDNGTEYLKTIKVNYD